MASAAAASDSKSSGRGAASASSSSSSGAGSDGGSVVRLGLMSTALIMTVKNYGAICKAKGIQPYAVASRSIDRAKAWADGKDLVVYGSYDELLDDPKVDAVYIPLPTGVRKEWLLKAAKKGKHILSEKPCANEASDLQEVLDACKEAGVQFMDGVMFMHHKRLDVMRTHMSNTDTFGTLRSVVSAHHFCAHNDFKDSNVRYKKELEPLGALGDLGWYNIRLSLWAFDYEHPVAVTGQCHEWVNGVPTDFSAIIEFSGGRSASFSTSFNTSYRQWAEFAGTKGCLNMRDLCIAASPEEVEFNAITGATTDSTWSTASEPTELHVVEGCCQEVRMWEKFAELVKGGKPDPFWPQVAMLTQVVSDALFESAKTNTKISLQGSQSKK